MNNEILATKTLITASVSGAAATGTSLSLIQQLNVLYPFLYLYLPLWGFFVLIVVVCLLGATGALLTDVMQTEKNSFKKVGLAFGTGLVSAFIILPSLVSAPTMGTLLLTALGASFSGTILVFILAQVLKDQTLQTAIKNSISKSILYAFSKVEGFIDHLSGSKK